MGRNPTSEWKVRGNSAPGALVMHPGARDAGPMPRSVRGRSSGGPSPARRRQPPIRAAYEHFRLERQGALVSRSTLDFYDAMVVPFLTWLDGEGVERFEHMGVEHARLYRARLASTPGRHGRTLSPDTLHGSRRAIGTFLRWAVREGYGVDGRILDLPAPRIPEKEPTVYHIAQVRKVLAACNADVPTEDLIVRVLVGSGIRRAEVVAGKYNSREDIAKAIGRSRSTVSRFFGGRSTSVRVFLEILNELGLKFEDVAAPVTEEGL